MLSTHSRPKRSLPSVPRKPNFKILLHLKFRGLGRAGLVSRRNSSPPPRSHPILIPQTRPDCSPKPPPLKAAARHPPVLASSMVPPRPTQPSQLRCQGTRGGLSGTIPGGGQAPNSSAPPTPGYQRGVGLGLPYLVVFKEQVDLDFQMKYCSFYQAAFEPCCKPAVNVDAETEGFLLTPASS